MKNLSYIEEILKNHYQIQALCLNAVPVSGGDIHHSMVLNLSSEDRGVATSLPAQLFAKFNTGIGTDVLESEFESLQLPSPIVANKQ